MQNRPKGPYDVQGHRFCTKIDFLLVINTNLPPVLHRFRDIAAWNSLPDYLLDPSLSEDAFYSARNARIASAVLATAIPSVRLSVSLSVRLSVRPSVRHTPVSCQNDGT